LKAVKTEIEQISSLGDSNHPFAQIAIDEIEGQVGERATFSRYDPNLGVLAFCRHESVSTVAG